MWGDEERKERATTLPFSPFLLFYTEPTDYRDECHCEECEKRRKTEGVAELLSGERLSLEPANLDRKTRNLLAKG